MRQSLFTFEDCLNNGRSKCQAAAEMLAKIYPGVNTSHHEISVPMPGHRISDALESDVLANYQQLDTLIQE